jgi:hypothetical protein
VIALTDWNELPECAWKSDRMQKEIDKPKWDKNFEKGIKLVIWVHDDKIEFLTDEPAIQKYREYNTLYGSDNYEKFSTDYYQDNHIKQVDKNYFIKLIESYGVTVEQGLKGMQCYEYASKLSK